jgi:hypothetical protein
MAAKDGSRMWPFRRQPRHASDATPVCESGIADEHRVPPLLTYTHAWRWWLVSGCTLLFFGMALFLSLFIARPPSAPVRPKEEASPKEASPKEASPQLAALRKVADILGTLEWGNLAFNSPQALKLQEPALIQLLLSEKISINELQDQITAVGDKGGARIRISDRMEARLTGPGFRIQAITPEIQAVGGQTTEWKWQINPTEPGPQNLHLTLSAILDISGDRVPHVIRTFDRVIEVRVSWAQKVSPFIRQNWTWLWTTLLVPLSAWLWTKVTRRRKRKRRG